MVAGTVILAAGQVSSESTDGYETLMESVLDHPVLVGGKRVALEDSPEDWFNGLPFQYDGSYLRARIIRNK